MSSKNKILFIIISVATIGLFFADITMGSVKISFAEIWNTIWSNVGDSSSNSYIIFNFRIPKAITALLAGAALSAVGLQMQTLFRNPLAGPYILGISSGASLGVAAFTLGLPLLGISVANEWWGSIGAVGAAWIGAALILLIILAVTARIKDIMAVLILGIMFGSAATALVELMQYLSPEGAVKSFVTWTMGSVGNVTLTQLWILIPVVAVGIIISIALIKPLNILLLGENYARTMGLNIDSTRRLIFISTILLAGTISAFCGPISFIGLAVPHIMRFAFSDADHKVLMPASIIAGGGIMLLCDIISQLATRGMPINTITSLIGIPVVVWVIIRNKKW